MSYHEIETRIRYLTPEEGGRKSPVFSGYRGQFYYDGDDYIGFQVFPDLADQPVKPGEEVRAYVCFSSDRWEAVHRHKLQVGKTFQIREGRKVVGEGVVTQLDPPTVENAHRTSEN